MTMDTSRMSVPPPRVVIRRARRDGRAFLIDTRRHRDLLDVCPLASLGMDTYLGVIVRGLEDFMLRKDEVDTDPGRCLKEGRRLTRCATNLIDKMHENCLEQFEAHWNCLGLNNQMCTPSPIPSATRLVYDVAEEFYAYRKPERGLNTCMFGKLVLRACEGWC